MRLARTITAFVLLLGVFVAFADEATTLVYFVPGSEHKIIRAEFRIDEDFPDTDSKCDNVNDCRDRYWLERRVGPRSPMEVKRVRIDPDAKFHTLELTLVKAPDSIEDVFVVFAGMFNTAKEALPWESMPLLPQIEQDEFGDGTTLTYRTLEPRDLTAGKPIVTAVDKDTGHGHVLPVKSISAVDKDGISHTLEIDNRSLPRGKKFKTSVEGLDTVKAKTTIERTAFPEKRDDASFYANGSIEADEVGEGSRAYKLDVFIAPKWKFHSDLWEHGPKIDMILGNKTSKAPNTALLGWDFKRFIVKELQGIASHSYSVGPQYRVDRQNENRDFELNAQYDPLFKSLEGKTVEQRRADLEREGEKDILKKAKWGYQLRPSIGLEAGWHLESTNPEVEDNSLTRIRGTITAMLERAIDVPRAPGTLKLTITGTARKLFSDEAVLDDEGALVKTDSSDRSFFRADLSYDIGPGALTLTHMNGRQPPAFSPTHSTSFGVTIKY